MEQRLTFITLGVKDLGLMADFYKSKFGWEPHKEMDSIVFFKLNGVILALYPAEELAADAKIPFSGQGWKQFTLSINYDSEEEVDKCVEQLTKNGVSVVKAPGGVFWGGYSAYVEDAEFNLWEIAYNPFLEMDEEGNVLGHE